MLPLPLHLHAGRPGCPSAFAARLEEAVDLDTIRADLASVVQQVLEPARISVWVSRRS